jgi:hypothetical protein
VVASTAESIPGNPKLKDFTADCDDIDPYTCHIAHASLRLCLAYRAPHQDGQTTTSLPYGQEKWAS